jgi:hypothetical protein
MCTISQTMALKAIIIGAGCTFLVLQALMVCSQVASSGIPGATDMKQLFKQVRADADERQAHRRLPYVAVSYLMGRDSTSAALETLLKSDIMMSARVDIFAFSNAPNASGTQNYSKSEAFRHDWRCEEGAEILDETKTEQRAHRRFLLTVDDVKFDEQRGWFDPRNLCPGLEGSQNLGIILPRIRIMEEILSKKRSACVASSINTSPLESQEGRNTKGSTAEMDFYDWVLEVHDDMLFPSTWFQALLDNDAPDVGILMPYLLAGHTIPEHMKLKVSLENPDMKTLDEYANALKRNTTIGWTWPAHPWLLKVAAVRHLGYYDPLLSPWYVTFFHINFVFLRLNLVTEKMRTFREHEDTDFFYYMSAISDWRCFQVGMSIVFHRVTESYLRKGTCQKACGDPHQYLAHRYGCVSSMDLKYAQILS